MSDEPEPVWTRWEARNAWVLDLGDDTVVIVTWSGMTESWMWAHTPLVEGRPQGPILCARAGFGSAAEAISSAEGYERHLL